MLGKNLSRGLRVVRFCIYVHDANIDDAIHTVFPTTSDEDVSTTVFVGPVGFESFDRRCCLGSNLDLSGATRVYSWFVTNR
jgi:hypothetical protein